MIFVSKFPQFGRSNYFNSLISLGFILFCLLQFSCEQLETPTNHIGALDITPPSITITSPQNNSLAKDTLHITFETQDDIGINRVSVTINGYETYVYLNTDDRQHYTYNVDGSYMSGAYTYVIKSYDNAGNMGSDSVKVTFQPIIRRVIVPGVNNIGWTVKAIASFDNSTVWFTTSKGLVRYSSGSFVLNPTGFDIYRPDLSSIAIDSHGLLWIAYDELYSAGANRRLLSYDGVSQLIVHNFPIVPNHSWAYFSSFAFDNNDSLFGLWYESISYGYFSRKNNFSKAEFLPYGTNGVRGLVIDNQNKKFFALSSEVRVLDGATWTVYNSTNSSIPAGTITGISQDKDKNVWITIATSNNKRSLAKFQGGVWTAFDGYPKDAALFSFDQDGYLWLTGSGYLWKYSGTTMVRQFQIESANAIYCDNNHNVWIATNYGIYQCNENGL